MFLLVLSALRGSQDDGFPSERELTIVMLVLQVWFAALVGWSVGRFDAAALERQTERAVGIILRGA